MDDFAQHGPVPHVHLEVVRLCKRRPFRDGADICVHGGGETPGGIRVGIRVGFEFRLDLG